VLARLGNIAVDQPFCQRQTVVPRIMGLIAVAIKTFFLEDGFDGF
jgi:hypothetical protein